MPDIETTTRRVTGLIAKYNGDLDTNPGLPPVTESELTILGILIDILSMINDLQQKTALLRIHEFIRDEIPNEINQVQQTAKS